MKIGSAQELVRHLILGCFLHVYIGLVIRSLQLIDFLKDLQSCRKSIGLSTACALAHHFSAQST
jgi:hypothetical protein